MLVYKVPVYLSSCYYKWREQERFAWSSLLKQEGPYFLVTFAVMPLLLFRFALVLCENSVNVIAFSLVYVKLYVTLVFL